MKTFEEYTLDWWHEYVTNQNEATQKFLMQNLIGEEETIDDYIPSDASNVEEWLLNAENVNADKIYATFFETQDVCPDNMPDTETFVEGMLMENVAWPDGDEQPISFAKEYVEDMAYQISQYTTPDEFFDALSSHGVSSGMIGMLIYNYDCKKLYIEHIDDMEDYKECLEEEIGAIKNISQLPHYTFVTWLCYEELALSIARALYPDKF